MNQQLHGHGIEDARLHCAFLLIVTNASKKPIMLHKHTNNAVETEPLSAVVKPWIDEEKEVPRMDRVDDAK